MHNSTKTIQMIYLVYLLLKMVLFDEKLHDQKYQRESKTWVLFNSFFFQVTDAFSATAIFETIYSLQEMENC